MRLPRFTPQLRRRILAHLALSFVSLSFGGLNVLSRVALAPSPTSSPSSSSSAHRSASLASPASPAPATVHPVTLGVCRDCGAFPILLLAYTLSQRARSRPLWRPRRSDMVLLAGCGVVGLYGNQILYVIGASLTSADLVSFYTATTPVVTCLMAVLLRMERLTLFKVTGVLLGIAGVVAMVVGSSPAQAPVAGHLCLLANAFCNGILVLTLKPLYSSPGATELGLITWAYGIGALCMLFTAAMYYAGGTVGLLDGLHGAGAWRNWLVITYAAVIGSATNYALITFSNSILSATTTCTYGALQPLFTVLLSTLFLGEPVVLQDVLGGWTIMVAIYVLSLAESHPGGGGEGAGKGDGAGASGEGKGGHGCERRGREGLGGAEGGGGGGGGGAGNVSSVGHTQEVEKTKLVSRV